MRLTGVGRLGQDAEVRYTKSGTAVASLSLAYDTGFGDEKETTWVKGSLWGKRAETLAEYLTKGTAVDVTLDNVKLETWEKRDGSEGVTLRGDVVTLGFVGGGNKEKRQIDKPATAGDNADAGWEDDVPF